MGLPLKPEGNPDNIHATATAIRNVASDVSEYQSEFAYWRSTLKGWQGPSARSFNDVAGKLDSATGDLVRSLRSTADKFDSYANSLNTAQDEYDGALAAVGVGVVGTIFTLGISDAIADGTAAGIISGLLGTLSAA